jgi:hypothetical protein
MKTVVAFLAGVLLAGLLPFAYSQSAWDRPESIAPANWIPISDSLGLALVEEPAREGIVLPPPVRRSLAGHFMVKHGGKWQRLVIVEPLHGGLGEQF